MYLLTFFLKQNCSTLKPKLINDIIISSEPFFREHNLSEDQYIFSYRITIENLSNRSIQLLERFWQIGDGLNWFKKINGEGVIGEKPVIYSAQTYSYNSWCPTPSKITFMRGHYVFKDIKSEELFRVDVPQMNFVIPQVLN